MTYTLAGDRTIEWSYVYENLPVGSGWVLDVGPSPTAELSKFALRVGYSVVAVGIESVALGSAGFRFVQGDLLEITLDQTFDWILNISTIEHFGLVGRYGVTDDNPDADLRGMEKLRTLMDTGSKMLLTIPVGQDAVIGPWHRVYGAGRLPDLLTGYRTLQERFWAKNGDVDKYVEVTRRRALLEKPYAEPPPHYYALGTFTLELL